MSSSVKQSSSGQDATQKKSVDHGTAKHKSSDQSANKNGSNAHEHGTSTKTGTKSKAAPIATGSSKLQILFSFRDSSLKY